MTITMKDTGGTPREPVPAGMQMAVCHQVFMLGFQDTNFGMKEQVYLGFQVPAHRTEIKVDEVVQNVPMTIGNRYTLSAHPESNIRKLLEAWRSKKFSDEEAKQFNIGKVLGQGCWINVIHNPKKSDPTVIYSNIASIMPLQPDQAVPAHEGPLMLWDGESPTTEQIANLPEWAAKAVGIFVDPNKPNQPSAQAQTDAFTQTGVPGHGVPPHAADMPHTADLPDGAPFDDDIPF